MLSNCILNVAANLLVSHMVFVGNFQKTSTISISFKGVESFFLVLLSKSSSQRHKGR